MKHIKLFEELNIEEPKVGDYIIISELQDRIGQITNDFTHSLQTSYETKFGNSIWRINRTDIKYWSKNKEELESILVENKYNI